MVGSVEEQVRFEAPRSGPVMCGGRHALVSVAATLARDDRDGVLAIVVATSGSTYRKPGALVLLDKDGLCAGVLSGGCLEAELEERAREVLKAGCARRVQFDTRDEGDRVFGSGSGCRGLMDVVLVPLPASDAPLRDALIDADRNGVGLDLDVVPDLGSGEARVARRRYRFDATGAASHAAPAAGETITLALAPTPRVVLLGAGPETPFLLEMMALLGWHAEIVERRERWRDYAQTIGPERLHAGGLDGLPELLAGCRFDAALVMNHHFDLDARCLRALATSAVGHVGLLGPRARRDALLGELGEALAGRLQPRLHAPVGLDLGGDGPEAIALAIIAQLQKHLADVANA